MLAEKSIIKFKNGSKSILALDPAFKEVKNGNYITYEPVYERVLTGIITNVWPDSYSVYLGARLPKLTVDESSSQWFFNVKPEDIVEVVRDASPKPKKTKEEEIVEEVEA